MSETLEEYKDRIRDRGYEGPLLSTSIRKEFLVTSCWRESSAIVHGSWYEEIYVWRLDSTLGGRTLIGEATGRNYFDVVKEIYEMGRYEEK